MNSSALEYTTSVFLLTLVLCLASGCGDDGQRLLRSLSPPEGYYRPLAAEIVILDGSVAEYSLEFTHEYEGMYGVGIKVSNPPSVAHPFPTILEVSISMFVNGREAWTIEGDTRNSPFSGGGEYPGGMRLLKYDVPKDLPLKTKVRSVLTITAGDTDFHSRYGRAVFFVSKMSDK